MRRRSSFLSFFFFFFLDTLLTIWLYYQVTMTDRGAAERACKDPNPIIDGRKANVNLAYLGAKPRSIQTGEMQTTVRHAALNPTSS